MVKISRPFRFVYPVTKKVNAFAAGYQSAVIIVAGRATATAGNSTSIPVEAGPYRIQLQSAELIVDIEILSIIDQETGEELLSLLSQHKEFYSTVVELCRNFQTKKFLTR